MSGKIGLFLTLFYMGGGPFWPAGYGKCCGLLEVASKLLPLQDFVPLNLSQALVESFVEFIFQKEKLDLEDS